MLSALAFSCLLWTGSVAWSKYLRPQNIVVVAAESHITAVPRLQTAEARLRCLNLVASQLVGNLDVRELSSPRQAAAVWLTELILHTQVDGDLLVLGTDTKVAVVLTYAVLMCDDSDAARQLWTAVGNVASREAVLKWSGKWVALPGAVPWESRRFRALTQGAEGPRLLALLWCGGSSFAETTNCLRLGWPQLSPGGIVFIPEYWKHAKCRRATDDFRRQASILNPLYTVSEHTRPAFGFTRKSAVEGLVVRSFTSLAFADIEHRQHLSVNLTEESPLLKRSDKCCNIVQFSSDKCCRPHAVFWQSG